MRWGYEVIHCWHLRHIYGRHCQACNRAGHEVHGCDTQALPPMSQTLSRLGIQVAPMPQGLSDVMLAFDVIVFGNVCVEGTALWRRSLMLD